MKTYIDLAKDVRANGGVKSFEMIELRKLEKAERLGAIVVSNIKKNLAGAGLSHFPETLPSDQADMIRIFPKSSALSKLLDVIKRPGKSGDGTIKKLLDQTAEEKLAAIREILEG